MELWPARAITPVFFSLDGDAAPRLRAVRTFHTFDPVPMSPDDQYDELLDVEPRHVHRAPLRPVLIFDGDCGFCRFWIERWKSWTRDRVEYVPYQDDSVAKRFPEIPVSEFETAVQWVGSDRRWLSGAAAVVQALATVGWLRWLRWLYLSLPWGVQVSEGCYRFVARRRMFFSRINRWLFGRSPELPRYQLTTRVLIRALGFVFLTAFVSLWVQIHGLVGERGILPAGEYMNAARQYFDQSGIGVGRYLELPTLGWIASGNVALHAYCFLGVVCSILVMAGFWPAPGLAGSWLFYLTLSCLGQDFLSYQWDVLLLEAGFLGFLIVPWFPRPFALDSLKSTGGVFLLRWLLFRLMFESGVVKWSSGDPVWHNFTALQYHFETQPLPCWISWYASQLPADMLKAATVLVFVTELLVPLFFFAPRRLRLLACSATTCLQLAIILTGNYGCFNWLTLVLCVALLDDLTIRQMTGWLAGIRLGRPLVARANRVFRKADNDAGELIDSNPSTGSSREFPAQSFREYVRRILLFGYGFVAILIGLAQLESAFGYRTQRAGPVTWLRQQMEPLHLVNPYGLFAVMTTSRPELIIEGSVDGSEWRPYIFKYKPGPLDRRPPIVPFHMPRLDWQMWFAALEEGSPPHWFQPFAQRLFERSPAVLGLLANDPFAGQTPKYLRVLVYDYRFTNYRLHKNTGRWWVALNRRYYVPPMTWDPHPSGRPASR